jgi:asparagine synthase (glutamine-hydrolysing)
MSGIAGILNLNGAPVDRRLLGRMTHFMNFRGPDEQRLWVEGSVGFGHTLLRTTDDAELEHQPFTLDGRLWVVADARIDARSDLIAELARRGEEAPRAATDVELVLRAYRAWGVQSVEHLLGDFSFAVWDAAEGRLFCARDHLGVKPLFYAHVGPVVVFSNMLDCLRHHPAVSDRLNDLAVADFLMFDLNQDKETTTFLDIRRVPPAHFLTCAPAGVHIRRYWTLPHEGPIYYRRRDDYVDRFRALLDAAVSDRLRTKRVGIFMSGGLDSPTLAATAARLLPRPDRSEARASTTVCAFTTTYDGYDDEHRYAGLVSRRLGIPIRFQGWSAAMADPGWSQTSFHTPEPVPYPNSLPFGWSHFGQVASHSRVALHGEGPDNALLYEWRPYLGHLIRQRRFGRLLQDSFAHVVSHGRIPLLPTMPRLLKRYLTHDAARPLFPAWLNRDFEKRLDLRARWESRPTVRSLHPVRPAGHGSFALALWQALFEGFDPANTRAAIEVRHPFVDLRLLRYMLAVPTIPWCRSKYLIRRAMQHTLPVPILRRPKAPLVHDPWVERVKAQGLPELVPARGLDRYVDLGRMTPSSRDPERFWVDFRARSLNYWLNNVDKIDRVGLNELRSDE